jgi:hypothetical protein
MGLFSNGDKVTVTNPIQPTNHKGGETGVVTGTNTVAGYEVVQIRNDSDGTLQGVWPEEITKR